MTIFVTGGAGYIGSHVVLALLECGEDVVVLDNLVTGFAWAVPDRATFIEGDVGDRELVARICTDYRIEALLHFAASTVVPESVTEPLKYYLNNTAQTANLFDVCSQNRVEHVVFSSTAAVYGGNSEKPVNEEVTLNPESPYARSKLMSEWILRDAAQARGFNCIALRYFNVAGADPDGRSGQSTANATHLIKVASQVALGMRPKLELYGDDYATRDGTCIRDYIHVSDLADAHITALNHLRAANTSGVFNCGYGRGYSVKEVIKAVEAEWGAELPMTIAERRLGDPAAIVADSSKLRNELRWTPKYDDLAVIVRTAMAWEKRCLQKQAV